MENLAAFTGGDFPPSFQGDRWAYAFSVFGLLGSCLLALEWGWRIVIRLIDERRPFREPVTVARLAMLGVLIATLCRISPDVFLVMSWPEISPHTRATVALVDRLMDGVSVIPMTFSWAIALFGGAMIEYQLVKKPVPANLWPTWRRMRRPLSMGALILIIALTLAFLR